MSMSDDTVELTLANVANAARGYGGVVTAVYGISGGCEVRFPSAHHATSFADTMADLGWHMTLAAPITDLALPVVLTVGGRA